MFDASVRTSRRPFFSPAQQSQDPRFGIAKDATNRGLRAEAGKPKGIIEPAWFSHPVIMPDFSPRREGEFPGNQGVSRPSQRFSTHSVGRRADFLDLRDGVARSL
jgi:hypothetical protein